MVNINAFIKPKRKVKITDKQYEQAQRDKQRWLECSCRPQDALLCPSCLAYNKEKYGDSIPFEF